MKRRDFLAASGGIAGALLPAWTRAEEKPCPPPMMGVSGGGTTATSCAAESSGPAPPWFLEMQDRTWTRLAGGLPGAPASSWSGASWQQGARVRDVFPPYDVGGTPTAVTTAFTGGCVDQARGELILAANGGHGDYYGNEVYALALRTERPGWKRLTDPTPAQYIDTTEVDSRSIARGDPRGTNLDYKDPLFPRRIGPDGQPYGNVRSVHGWGKCCFGNGKVWYANLTGVAAGNSGQTSAVWSFDRDQADALLAANDGNPLSYRHAPWKYWGRPVPDGLNINIYNMEAGPGAYDRIGNKVWSVAGVSQLDVNGANGAYGLHTVDAATGAFRAYAFVNRDGAPGLGGLTPAGDPGFGGQWLAIAHDLRVGVLAQAGSSLLWLINLDNPAAGITRILPSVTPGAEFPSGVYQPGYGAVYHAPSRAILIYETRYGDGSRVRKLSIPANPWPTDPAESGYVWSYVNADSANTVTPSNGNSVPSGIYGKFNIVDDMGNGQSALVLVTSTLGPVFVYKLPRAGV